MKIFLLICKDHETVRLEFWLRDIYFPDLDILHA